MYATKLTNDTFLDSICNFSFPEPNILSFFLHKGLLQCTGQDGVWFFYSTRSIYLYAPFTLAESAGICVI